MSEATIGEDVSRCTGRTEPPLRILVVDDDDGFLQAMKRLFHARGFDTHIARDGLQAIELVRRYTFDVACLDLWMPGRNGLETFESLRAIQPGLPIITMSAMGTSFTKETCEKMGSFQYLQKPFGSDIIVAAIEEAARQKEDAVEQEAAACSSRGVLLLADDHDAFRTTLARRLRGDGFIVDEAATGTAAVSAWSRRKYDLGLLDLHMPDGSGADAAAAIHEMDCEAVLAFMTGEATQREVDESARHAHGVCLTKPLSFEKISQKILFLIEVGRRTHARRMSYDEYDSLSAFSKSLFRLERSFKKFRRSGKDRLIVLLVAVSTLLSLPFLQALDAYQRARLDQQYGSSKSETLSDALSAEMASPGAQRLKEEMNRIVAERR